MSIPASSDSSPTSLDSTRVAVAVRQGRLLRVAACAVVLAGALAMLAAVLADRDATLRHAERELTHHARAYAEHVSKTVEGADQTLRFLRAEHRRMNLALSIRDYLRNEDIIQADFHQLGIIGADGFLENSSTPFTRVDLRDRAHFRAHADAGAPERLFISKPVLGRASGKWSIQFTRRITRPDGAFGGVAVLSMPPEYFSKFFQSTSDTQAMATLLVGTDGGIRAASAMDAKALGRDLGPHPLWREALARKEGVAIHRLGLDGGAGVERIWAFRTLADRGLVVLTGRAMGDVLASWRQRALSAAVVVVIAAACVLALAIALGRHLRRQAELLAALQSGTRQLRQVVATMVDGSNKVAAAGTTMSVSAQQLAIRTDRQGEHLQDTSQSVRAVVGQVADGTARVGRVDARCGALREQTHGGMAVVARSVEAIEAIASRSREMGEAVAMIESIAFQTNLLALNAAVEAARAGDAGRAFAVVAGEVRELANRSRGSAAQVRALIGRAIEQAATGVNEAAAVRQVLDGIAGGVDDVADEMRAVATDAERQSRSLAEVMGGLDQLAELTRSNADMVAESVMAAEDMREHAQRLRQVVADIERDLPEADADPGLDRIAPPAHPGLPAVADTPAKVAKAPSVAAEPSAAVEYF